MTSPGKATLILIAALVGAVVGYLAFNYSTTATNVFVTPAAAAEASCPLGSITEIQNKSDELKGSFASSKTPEAFKAIKDYGEMIQPGASELAIVKEEWSRTTEVGIYVGPKGNSVLFMFDAKGCIVDYMIGVGNNLPKLQSFTLSRGT